MDGLKAGWLRFLARQFAQPSGVIGRRLIAPLLDRIGRPMNRTAFEQLRLAPGETVLELGFGGGDLLSWLLATAAGRVIGIDPSDAMLARARRRFGSELERDRLHLSEGSAGRVPVGDAAVDAAVSVNTLYFWEDVPAGLAELARVVRPGGRLVLCFQTPAAVRAWPGHVHGFRAYEPDAVAAYMGGCGFAPPAIVQGENRRVGEYACLTSIRT